MELTGRTVALQDRKQLLHYACEGGHLEVVQLLLGNGAAVDAVDKVLLLVVAVSLY